MSDKQAIGTGFETSNLVVWYFIINSSLIKNTYGYGILATGSIIERFKPLINLFIDIEGCVWQTKCKSIVKETTVATVRYWIGLTNSVGGATDAIL